MSKTAGPAVRPVRWGRPAVAASAGTWAAMRPTAGTVGRPVRWGRPAVAASARTWALMRPTAGPVVKCVPAMINARAAGAVGPPAIFALLPGNAAAMSAYY